MLSQHLCLNFQDTVRFTRFTIATNIIQKMTSFEALDARAPQTVLFDVSFPEKLLKIVATRDEIFSLKFTKYRLAVGLRPDPLGELKRSPDPLAAIRGLLLRGEKGRRGEGKKMGGDCPFLKS